MNNKYYTPLEAPIILVSRKYLLCCPSTKNISTFTTTIDDLDVLKDDFRKIWSLKKEIDVLVFNITNSEVHINV